VTDSKTRKRPKHRWIPKDLYNSVPDHPPRPVNATKPAGSVADRLVSF